MIVTVSSSAQLLTALKAAKPADTIQLAPGVYTNLQVENLKLAGSVTVTSLDAGHPAVLTGLTVRGSSGLTFKDLEFRVDPSSTYQVLSSQNVHFSGIDMHGSLDGNPQNDGGGLMLRATSNVSVTDSEFHELYWGVAHLDSNGVAISGNAFHDIRMDGIRGGGTSNIQIVGNSFRDFKPVAGDHADAIQFWTSNTTASAHDILIADNTFERGSGEGAQGIFLRDEGKLLPYEHVIIRGNLVSGGLYNGIGVFGAKDVVAEDNIVQGYTGMNSWIILSRVTGGVIADNATNLVTVTYSTNVTQTGNTILPLASDMGAAARALWETTHADDGASGGVAPVTGAPGVAAPLGVSLLGGAGVDTLTGGAGADTLNGMGGADRLVGGAGDDLYVASGKFTVVEAAGGGFDTLRVADSFKLPANVENLQLAGTGSFVGQGSADNNVISGNPGANYLIGMGGADTLTGGAGADTFVYTLGAGRDVIRDFGAGGEHDAINASALFAAGAKATLTQTAGGVNIAFSTGESILVQNIALADLHATTTGWVF